MIPFPFRRLFLLLCCGIPLACLVGCDFPKRPPLKAEPSASSNAGRKAEPAPQLALESPGTPFEEDWETWDAYFIQDRQVGYSHTQATSSGSGSSGDVRYELESRLYVNQGPARLLQRVSQVSTETTDGRLLSFEGVVAVGPARTHFSGTVSDGNLTIETERGASRTKKTLPWIPTSRGLVALEQSLRQRPMQTKGEQRVLKMLLPGRYELATATLSCLGTASVPLLDGNPHELIEIDCAIQTDDGAPAYSTIWTTADGEIARTHSPALQLIAYRTDEQTATGFEGNDQIVASLPLSGEIKDPQEANMVGFRVRPTAAAARAKVAVDFPPAPDQFVRAREDGLFEVLVSRKMPNPGKGFVASELTPSEADTAANAYVDSNHPEILKFLKITIKGEQLSDREVAMELTHSVQLIIADQPQMGRYDKASTVAKSFRGDATERAILLTALLRASRIPTRVVFGLKYLPGTPARLVYHPWTIAFVDGRWMHLDPSEGGLAAADRLVFATTDLASGDEFEAIEPLLETMRLIQVEVAGQN